jgi:serine/threonine protein kinase
MTGPDEDRVQEIYDEARNLPPTERRAFVEKAAAGNTEVARDVLDLLDLDDEGFMEPPIRVPLAPLEDDLVGKTISERYFIEKEFGGGGMSRVYLARDLIINGRAVVIKVLSLELLENPQVRQMFEQEVEALSRIHHAGVVDVFDKRELPDGRPYFVMEFIAGDTLRSQILANEEMNLDHAASILKQIGAALEQIHQHGIFHRDLKPENIMVRRGADKIVLIDFGIANVTDPMVAEPPADGQTAGTLPYMSPEQIRREVVTAASDVFSMAVVAYEMVTGRRPFNASSTEEQLKLQQTGVAIKPIALRPNLPLPAQDVILRGLSFKPQARYQNANQFGDSLANALIHPHITPIPKRWLYVLLLILGVAMLSFGGHKYCNRNIPRNHFDYFLTVQRMHDNEPYLAQFRSHGDEPFYKGDKFRLTVSSPVDAYFYIFKDAPPASPDGFRIIYPARAAPGAANLGANQPFNAEWMTFSDLADAENFWIVWSTSPVPELESVASDPSNHSDKGITGQTLISLKQYLTAKKAEIDAITYNYNANKTAVVRAKPDLIVALAQFKHR